MTAAGAHWADPNATAAVRKLLRRHRAAMDTVLTAARQDGLIELADATTEYVTSPEGPGTPEGAAVAFAIAQYAATAHRTGPEREREFVDRFIDSWLIEHGHAFVSEVAQARNAIRVEEPDPRAGRMTPWLRHTTPDEAADPTAEVLTRRVEARLTARPEPPRPAPKSVTTDQIRRLEAAMVDGRRWRAVAHRRLIVDDPALVELARRLVWASFDGHGTVLETFRIDDRTPRDLAGASLELPPDRLIGVAHPIHLGATLAAWRNMFADSRSSQPFEQLNRRVHHLTPAESESNVLSRFTDRQLRADRLFGLQELGWEVTREALYRRFGPTRELTVTLAPGLEGGYSYEPEPQRIRSVELRGGVFGALDPVTASELIGQLTRLAA
ncbi:hypothetical protein NS506_02566 [Nocardia seriolae]|uniref:DUF4132 domain-containing protein n=1 Tax=Nocardia seriolae TaxID=37332 RepID=A0ABC8AQZ6_9NOCA|nr:DUF4132 domain-containing protein [Nocardia seriolae]APA96629.1 hypothetical protein NS506_02566 [Nocardia seriolae]OJF77865.1 hypothetical protein NS14008_38315 [Nocardia seriolae]QUN15300.1 DUF4132 domain-containing protein [Nocardia seriolae]WNJ57706.1 DUF4132 domain-containing protein [Nocardia seriolae]